MIKWTYGDYNRHLRVQRHTSIQYDTRMLSPVMKIIKYNYSNRSKWTRASDSFKSIQLKHVCLVNMVQWSNFAMFSSFSSKCKIFLVDLVISRCCFVFFWLKKCSKCFLLIFFSLMLFAISFGEEREKKSPTQCNK